MAGSVADSVLGGVDVVVVGELVGGGGGGGVGAGAGGVVLSPMVIIVVGGIKGGSCGMIGGGGVGVGSGVGGGGVGVGAGVAGGGVVVVEFCGGGGGEDCGKVVRGDVIVVGGAIDTGDAGGETGGVTEAGGFIGEEVEVVTDESPPVFGTRGVAAIVVPDPFDDEFEDPSPAC